MSDWRDEAACLGMPTEVFFPENTGGVTSWMPRRIARAMAVCNRCPVRQECLEMVLRLPEHVDREGVFGATTRADRVRIRRERGGTRLQGRAATKAAEHLVGGRPGTRTPRRTTAPEPEPEPDPYSEIEVRAALRPPREAAGGGPAS